MIKERFIKIKNLLLQENAVAIAFFTITLLATFAQLLKPTHAGEYTRYNNYVIFQQSFFHLIHHQDLYQLYPAEHWDYYKYSPTFALLMAPLAILPTKLGFVLWNVLNAIVLFFSIRALPIAKLNQSKILWFIIPEMVISLQNSQSNALIAGLLIFTFAFLEKGKFAFAALCVALSFYIKIFGILALILFLFYTKWWHHIFKIVIIFLVLAGIPLLVINWQQLVFLYKSWLHLLAMDESASIGYSVRGWLFSWFGVDIPNIILVVTGMVLLLFPLVKKSLFSQFQFRLFYLSAIMIWIIIFNHKAESPTFIIAVAGFALFYFNNEKFRINEILFWAVLIFTQLAHSDLFPPTVKEHFMMPYVIKAVPCIAAWAIILFRLLQMPDNKEIGNAMQVNSK